MRFFLQAFLPSTGETTNYTPYIFAGLGILVLGGLVLLTIADKKRKNAEQDDADSSAEQLPELPDEQTYEQPVEQTTGQTTDQTAEEQTAAEQTPDEPQAESPEDSEDA